MRKHFVPRSQPGSVSFALLVSRGVMGVAFILHGVGKINAGITDWGDGMGFPAWAQVLAVAAEVLGGAALVFGLLTPLAALAIGGTMLVALHWHVIERGDAFVSTTKKSWELAAVYFCMSLLMFVAGPGRYSVDASLFKDK